MGRYHFSNQAEEDLIEIYCYGFLNYGEAQAERYQRALKEKCRFIADRPFLCREREEFSPPVRICHHQKHLIIYTITGDDIFILRIRHERMDIPSYLED